MPESPYGYRIIVIPEPGEPARQLYIPRAWPLLLCAASLLSVVLSMSAGRTVRALYDEHAQRSEAHVISREFWTAPRTRSTHIVWSPTHPQKTSVQLLRLFDVNRKEALAIAPFSAEGALRPEVARTLQGFMRCRRTGHEVTMNPRLIVLLSRIAEYFDNRELEVISAHRAIDGVVTSETSQHGKGNATDLRIQGVSSEELAAAARMLGAGGVGVYTKHRFVHVDVRDKPYFWRDGEAE